jgi:hypothetical protein
VIAFTLALGNAARSAPEDEILSPIRLAASAGLPSFLAAIPSGEQALYGFAPGEDVMAARVGEPIGVVYAERAALLDIAEKDLARRLVTDLKEYEVPVLLKGRLRAFLTVAWHRGKWQAVGIGGAARANDLVRRARALPASPHGALILECLDLRMEFLLQASPSGNEWMVERVNGPVPGAAPGGGPLRWDGFRASLREAAPGASR